MGEPLTSRWLLRDLPLPSRLVLSLFLMSVGFGYCSALVQLHFAGGAKAGEPLPGIDEIKRIYGNQAGAIPMSQLERLLTNKEGGFNGAGTMAPAFTTKSDTKWKDILEKTHGKGGQAAVDKLLAEREGERLGLLAWAHLASAGQTTDFKRSFKQDKFPLPETLANQTITPEFLVTEKVMEGDKEVEKVVEPKVLKIRSLFETRCITCHAEDGRSNDARLYPLDDLDKLKPYTSVKAASTGMSLSKLAQTTHVHLLAFSMLYALTGLIFTFTSYPAVVRFALAPLALGAQLVEISCWWLARVDPGYGLGIQVMGGIVAVALMAHIIGSLFDMYALKGKIMVAMLILTGAIGGGMVYQQVIGPYLAAEKAAAEAQP